MLGWWCQRRVAPVADVPASGVLLTHLNAAAPAARAPSVALPYTPAGALPLNGAAGRCNGYVPNSSTLTRFLWTVGVLARNGFIIVIGAPLLPLLPATPRWAAARAADGLAE